MEEIHHDRHRRHREKARGQRARSVVQAVDRVEWDGEETALLPLEACWLLALVPHLARAAAVQDEEVLLEEVLLGRARLARFELDEVCVVGVLGAPETDVGTARVEPRPPHELGLAEIGNRDPGVDRNALGLEEELVRAAPIVVGGRLWGVMASAWKGGPAPRDAEARVAHVDEDLPVAGIWLLHVVQAQHAVADFPGFHRRSAR